MATRHADWTKEKMTRSGLPLILSTGPHEKTIQAVEARGEWPCIRPIEGIIESPTIRPDGTILSIPGWDEITGLLYEPGTDFGVIPDQPSRLDAQEAAGKILLVVRDFPFADDAHLATWLAGLLTVVGRHAIEGPTPLFLIDANAPGTGKSLLCDIPAMIATGRPMSRADYPEDDAEMAKTILSIALAAERVVMFDNISSGGTIGGPSLDRALTARTVKGRILGRSEMSAELPMNACFWATGNNIGLKGDAMRRVVPCRLESMVERPEERCDFSIKGDILQYVGNHRTELVVAALTILRAHAVAGRPDAGLTPFGSYEAWSNVIRNAVHWVTGHDPCKSREAARLDDPESIEREAIVLGLAELPNIRSGLTAAEILRILDNKDHQDKFETLRDVILGWSKDSKLPGSKVVGRHLRVQKGRVVSGKVLTSKPYDGSQRWSVKDV
jgi:hypothetical protein